MIPFMAALLNTDDGESEEDWNAVLDNILMNTARFIIYGGVQSAIEVNYVKNVLFKSGILGLGVNMIGIVKYSHYPELCLSWLSTCKSFKKFND